MALVGSQPPVSIREQRRCVERELTMRQKIYPRWVANGRMTAAEAAREIATMTAVLATLQSLPGSYAQEPVITPLYEGPQGRLL
jgi:hypothetical protein